MRLHSLVYLLSIIVSTHQATIQDTLNDLSTIKTEVIGLDNAITNFPAIGGTLVAGLAVHARVQTILSDLDKTTADVKTIPTPVSAEDGVTVLNAVDGIIPVVEDGLRAIVARKNIIQPFGPLGSLLGIIRNDLVRLNSSAIALGDALIAVAPAEVLPAANADRAELLAAFATAIAAYA